jgi:phosphatidylcholine synthase
MQKVVAGYLVHSITALGAIAGLISLEEFISGSYRSGLLWLIICQLIDGFDGPIARKIDIHIHATRFDGHILESCRGLCNMRSSPGSYVSKIKFAYWKF